MQFAGIQTYTETNLKHSITRVNYTRFQFQRGDCAELVSTCTVLQNKTCIPKTMDILWSIRGPNPFTIWGPYLLFRSTQNANYHECLFPDGVFAQGCNYLSSMKLHCTKPGTFTVHGSLGKQGLTELMGRRVTMHWKTNHLFVVQSGLCGHLCIESPTNAY